MWVWVQTIHRMRSPPQPAMASRWLGVVGTGVDHDDLVDADEVGVGARAGHQPGVVGDDAPHQRAQRAGHAGHDRLRLRRPPGRRGRSIGSAASERQRWRGRAACGRAAASSSSHVAKRPMSWRLTMVGPIMAKSPARWRRERVGRPDPLAADDLAVVVGVRLALRGTGEEEPGVEALGLALRRDPVREVADVAERELRSSAARTSRSDARRRSARGGGRRSALDVGVVVEADVARRPTCGRGARPPPRRPRARRPPRRPARRSDAELRPRRRRRRGPGQRASRPRRGRRRRRRRPGTRARSPNAVLGWRRSMNTSSGRSAWSPSRTSITVAPSRVGTGAGHRPRLGRSGGSSQLSTSHIVGPARRGARWGPW